MYESILVLVCNCQSAPNISAQMPIGIWADWFLGGLPLYAYALWCQARDNRNGKGPRRMRRGPSQLLTPKTNPSIRPPYNGGRASLSEDTETSVLLGSIRLLLKPLQKLLNPLIIQAFNLFGRHLCLLTAGGIYSKIIYYTSPLPY